MKFYESAGRMALGSRLRRLSEIWTNDAQKLYKLYGVELEPRWLPVFFMLNKNGSASISELAIDIGQTHAAVSQIVSSMLKKGIVNSNKGKQDGRKNIVSLSEKGKEICIKLKPQCEDVDLAVAKIIDGIDSEILADLDALEEKLKERSLYQRVRDQRKLREAKSLNLVPIEAKYEGAFKDLNISWIEKHWDLSDSDYQALNNPIHNIVKQGGYIVIALYCGIPVGTCALLKKDNENYELAKLAVADSVKGMGIGFLIAQHILNQAKEMKAKRVYLESHSILKPALSLYKKLGFQEMVDTNLPVNRCNVQMEIFLS